MNCRMKFCMIFFQFHKNSLKSKLDWILNFAREVDGKLCFDFRKFQRCIYYYCFVQLSAGLGRNESCDSNIRETIVKECKTLTFVKLNNDLIDLQMFIIFSSSNLNLYRNLSTLSIWSRKHFSLTIRPRNTMHCAWWWPRHHQ